MPQYTIVLLCTPPPKKKNVKSSAEIMSSRAVFVCTWLKSASKVSWIHFDFLKRLKIT